MEKDQENKNQSKLRFDGIYICFNSYFNEQENVEYDLVFQFFEDGKAGFGDFPHTLNSPEIREFIRKNVEKLDREGKTQEEIRRYYNERWFYDLYEYSSKEKKVEIVKFEYIDAIYQIENNNITINRGNATIQKQYTGIIKKDALDLHITYSFTEIEDNDLYEFIAFDF